MVMDLPAGQSATLNRYVVTAVPVCHWEGQAGTGPVCYGCPSCKPDCVRRVAIWSHCDDERSPPLLPKKPCYVQCGRKCGYKAVEQVSRGSHGVGLNL